MWTTKKSLLLLFGLIILAAFQQLTGNAQLCFSTGAPYNDDNSRNALPPRSQAIVTTYEFQCCGVVQNWRAYFQPGGNKHTNSYTVTFQIWRPVADQLQCYMLLSDITANPQLSNRGEATVSASSNMVVQPGDVIGYYVTLQGGGNGGIQLETSNLVDNTVWYSSSPTRPGPGQTFQVGTGSSFSSTTAAPIISIDITSMPCSPLTTAPPTTSTGTERTMTVITEQLSNLSSSIPPTLASTSSRSSSTDSSKLSIEETELSSSHTATVVVVVLVFVLLLTGAVTAVLVGWAVWMKKRKQYENNFRHSYQFSNPNYFSEYPETTTNGDSMDNLYEVVSPYSSPYQKSSISEKEDLGHYEHISVYKKYLELKSNTAQKTREPSKTSKDQESTLVHKQDITTEDQCTDDDLKRIIYDSPGLVVPNQEERNKDNYGKVDRYSKLMFFEQDETFWVPANSSEELYDQLASKKYREISRKDIIMIKEIEDGDLGTVSKAMWKMPNESIMLAVKEVHSNSTSMERIKLLQEAAIIGQFSHKNVVKLYGLVTIANPVCLCLEFMSKGDLNHYLKNIDINRYVPPNGHKDIESFFVRAALDVASGMKYLSSKSFIHRDLAARNILLNDSYVCKIGDFGMARDLMDEIYYTSTDRTRIPVRWTSPEALFYKKYSSASDVWSFGMVLFEIWSVGKLPFPNFTISKVLEALQKKGYCQQPPPGCPRAIYKLMIECWNPVHQERPKFEQIITQLQQPSSYLLYLNYDQHCFPPTAAKLGGDFAVAEKLHSDLQLTYNVEA